MRRSLLIPLGAVLALAGLTLFLLGRGGEAALTAPDRPQPGLAGMPTCADTKVTFRLHTDSPLYLPGQAVRVSFEVRNLGTGWCKVAGQCDEVAPMTVFDDRRPLWSDRPCLNHEWDAVNIPLPPGRPVTYQGSWSTRGVGAGLYEARAAFLRTSFLVL